MLHHMRPVAIENFVGVNQVAYHDAGLKYVCPLIIGIVKEAGKVRVSFIAGHSP